jgi:glycine cleavage system H protein
MNNPRNLKYNIDHVWVKTQGGNSATIGITDFAKESMGEITYVELPHIGTTVGKGEFLCTIASQKTMVDLPSPLSGEVLSVNEELETEPQLINESPYEQGWLIGFNASKPEELDDLMSSEGYEKFLEAEVG